jgi:ATP-dependent Clp protease ATP-binding subunit ClpC
MWIDEPSREEAVEILMGAKSDFEKHYNLTINQDAIETAVDLSIRYIPDQKLPDKALDLLDQACAQQALQSISIKTRGQELDISAIRQEVSPVGRENIARVISKRCRVPYELLAITEQERLKILEHHLTQRVIGQENALQEVTKALRAAYLGLKDPRRPITSFLFAGPTGVGKTETARALAEFLFGSSESLIRIDLSEYMEKHQVARLLGAPPGYIGYESPGMLTSSLRQRPASVVLFDEVEKAHPDVLNVLLQILDQGQLTDGQGRKASFRETVVVLTSNILSEQQLSSPLGFRKEAEQEIKPLQDRERLLSALQRYLRPELMGRIQHIILFEPLSHEVCIAIAEKVLNECEERLRKGTKGTSRVPEQIRKHIMEKIHSHRFGAREIQQLVESEVAAWLVRREVEVMK